MLSLNLKPGEYMTVGGNVVVQLDRINGDRCKLLIDAPKELTILRGEVLEPAPLFCRGRACPSRLTGLPSLSGEGQTPPLHPPTERI